MSGEDDLKQPEQNEIALELRAAREHVSSLEERFERFEQHFNARMDAFENTFLNEIRALATMIAANHEMLLQELRLRQGEQIDEDEAKPATRRAPIN